MEAAGSGVIEAVISLSGSIPAGDCWIWTESTYSLGGGCMNTVGTLNFEHTDNVTHILVEGFYRKQWRRSGYG